MRVTSSTFALLAASLLVTDAIAGPMRKRDYYLDTDSVVITEEIWVTELADGSYVTGAASAVGTATIDGKPVLMTEAPAAPSIAAVATSSTSALPSLSSVKAVFIESPKSLVSVASTSSSIFVAPTVKAPEPTKSTPAEVPTVVAPAPVKPTTLAPVILPTVVIPSPVKPTIAPAPVPTTTSKAAPVATVTPPSTGSGKRGLAFNNADLLSAFTSSSEVSWAYNWGSSTKDCPEKFEYVPMLWGTATDHSGNWDAMVTKALASGSQHLLGFNEPDYSGQANLSPSDAAAGWMQFMQPYASKAKLGAPATTNGGAPMGLTWLSNFMTACASCTIDFVPIHWYNGGDVAAFKAYMAKAYTAGGNRPLWITEFEVPGSDDEKAAFLNEVMAWMDETSYIERYAYFMVSDGSLVSGTSLSKLGGTYAAAN